MPKVVLPDILMNIRMDEIEHSLVLPGILWGSGARTSKKT
jgi:hypothetical protein